MKIKHDLERNRVLKHKASGGLSGANLTAERAVEDLTKGRTIM